MKIWLAPLHGITSCYVRNTLYRHVGNIDMAIVPFYPTQERSKLNVKKWNDLFPENNLLCDIIPQLMGNNPAHIVDTIQCLNESFGYKAFNLNVGCPVNNIVRKKRGCGLMPYPDLVEKIVETVLKLTNCRFSIKMRLGVAHPEEGRRMIEKLNRYPLDFIVIHPRLGIQQYDGNVDLDNFADLLSISKNKIIYNGDICTIDDFKKLQNRFPCIDEWMIGRGLLKNPFLSEEIVAGIPLSSEEKNKRFISFYQELHQLIVDNYKSYSLPKLKELWHYFAFFFGFTSLELKELLRCNHVGQFEDYLNYIIK